MIFVWNMTVNGSESRSNADNRHFDDVVKRKQSSPYLEWDLSKVTTGYGHKDVVYVTDHIDRHRNFDATANW